MHANSETRNKKEADQRQFKGLPVLFREKSKNEHREESRKWWFNIAQKKIEEVLPSMHANLETRNKKEADQRQFEGAQRKIEQALPGLHGRQHMKKGLWLRKVVEVQLDRIILYWLAEANTTIQDVKVKRITGQEKREICRDTLVMWDPEKIKKILEDGLENGSDQRKVAEKSLQRSWKERKKPKENWAKRKCEKAAEIERRSREKMKWWTYELPGPHGQERGGKVMGGRTNKKEARHEQEMQRRDGL